MSLLEEIESSCPYCGSPLTVEAEPGIEAQRFIEDCHVCCAPIEFELVMAPDGGWQLTAKRDDE